MMRTLGSLLLVVGLVCLAYAGWDYMRSRRTVNVGPLSATIRERRTDPTIAITGGVAVIAGALLIAAAGRRRV